MKGQPDISTELSAYLDGQLPYDAARWVDRAATENPDVARRLHDLRRIRTVLRSLEPVRPSVPTTPRTRATGSRPRKEYRASVSPPSIDSRRNGQRAPRASLRKAAENAANASNMIGTAEAALNEVNTLLIQIRESAIFALNTASL